MRLAWPLLALVVGCRSTPSAAPPVSASTSSPSTDRKVVSAQTWTVEYEGALVEAISEDAHGVYVAMSMLPDPKPARLPHGPLQVDVQSVATLWLGHDGEIREAHVFEGEGADVGGLRGSVLTLVSWGSVRVGEDVYAAPAREAVFGMPSVAVAVRVGESADVIAVVPDVESAQSWPLAGDQLLVAAVHRDDMDETSTQLQLFVHQQSLWSTAMPDREITAVLQTPQQTWVATGTTAGSSDVRRLDLHSGELSEPIIVVRPQPESNLAITAITDGPRAWGESRGIFVATTAGVERILDVAGHVAAVDDRDVLVDVYGLEPDRSAPTVDATGIYLLRRGETIRVGPAVSNPILTTTHVVFDDDCDTSSCVRAVPR